MNKYIKVIDEFNKTVTQIDTGKWVISKPMSATGLLKWKIRFIYAFACLTGKAIAVKFWTGEDFNGNRINTYK